MQLVGRMLATITAIILFSLCVFIGLATLQYNSILSDLTRDRLIVLSNNVRTPFQAVADLGVPIGTMRNADAVLERARSSDESIIAIHVVSADGNIVRSTATQPPLQPEPVAVAAVQEAGESANWHIERANDFLVGANIADLSGASAGAILIVYSKREANTQVQAMEARLVLLAALVLIVSVLALMPILRIVLSEHLRIFEGILESYDGFERRFWRGTATSDAHQVKVEGLGFSTVEFASLIDQSEQEYETQRDKASLSDGTGPP